jgi:hypothetical protein
MTLRFTFRLGSSRQSSGRRGVRTHRNIRRTRHTRRRDPGSIRRTIRTIRHRVHPVGRTTRTIRHRRRLTHPSFRINMPITVTAAPVGAATTVAARVARRAMAAATAACFSCASVVAGVTSETPTRYLALASRSVSRSN